MGWPGQTVNNSAGSGAKPGGSHAMTAAPVTTALPLACDTPQKLFRARSRAWADNPALRHKKKGIWDTTTWAQYFERARGVGLALSRLGLQTGDSIAIISENRPEWLYADLGAQCMGILSTGIYPTSSPEQLLYILQDAGVRLLFVENQEQYDKVLAVRAQCPALQHIVITERKGLRHLADPMVTDFAQFLAQGLAQASQQAGVFDAATG
ncbi:MAG: hypothetical protein EB007_05030 [Betaproteobacteria bacterium]|nr:hypothetical protein [Betaproteobacteria bacterium]NDE41332.1 hypothetical protein [Betaproteobacteria bacterium]